MSWFDALIQQVRDAFSGVVSTVQDTISSSLAGVSGALNYVAGGLTGAIYNAQNNVGNAINYVYNGLNNTIGSVQSNIGNTINGATGYLAQRLTDTQNEVATAANNVVNTVTNNVSSGLANVSNVVNGAVYSLTSNINNITSAVGNAVNSARSAIQSQIDGAQAQTSSLINNLTGGIGSAISNGLNTVTSSLGTFTQNIQAGIDSALAGVGADVSAVVTGLTASLQNLSPDLGAIVKAIEMGQPIQDAIKTLGDLVKLGLEGWTVNLDLVSTHKAQTYADILSGKYTDPQQLVTALFDPPPDESFPTRFIELMGAIVGVLGLFSAVGGVLARPWVQAINHNHQTELLTADQLALGVVQSQIDATVAADNASFLGLAADKFDFLVRLAGNPPGLGEVLEMWRRGFMTEDQVNQALKESRLKNKYNDQVKQLRYVLPPISDVIRMAVREAWDDSVANQFGYDADFPAKVSELAPQLGIDPDWIRRYWRAHWTLPSVQQLFEMLHRTKETGVTAGVVDQALRVNDVPEYWRQKLIAISYAPFTRVDVRRMYKTKVLDIAAVKQAYLDIGYNDQRAQQLADFTVKLEDTQAQLDPDALERKIYTALENLFVRGKRSESDLRTAMQKFGWGQTAIDSQVEIAKLREEAYNKVDSKDISGLTDVSVQRQIVEKTIDLYIRNQKTLGDVSAAMNEYGWGDDIQQLILKRAELDKLYDAAPTQKQQLKDLSISAVLEAYVTHTYTVDETKTRLMALGLSADDAQTYIDIKDYQAASSQRTKIIAALQKAFEQNRLTETQTTTALLQFGFAQPEAENYLTLWTLEKSLIHKDFTEAQLATFFKHGVISGQQYETELANLGWSPDQIKLWAALRGADVTVTG